MALLAEDQAFKSREYVPHSDREQAFGKRDRRQALPASGLQVVL
jgi:hypothetical protein